MSERTAEFKITLAQLNPTVGDIEGNAARVRAARVKAAADGAAVPATEPEAQRVRSASIELEKDVSFTQGARHGLYAALGTDPLSV